MHPAYLEARFRSERAGIRWPREFVIITAFATTGYSWTTEQNADADRRLEAALSARGFWHERITGYSPTTGHAEPGWAASLPLNDALMLGREFVQDAIYAVRGDHLSVAPCAGDGALQFVGLFSERLDA